jgi:hypothetical protein
MLFVACGNDAKPFDSAIENNDEQIVEEAKIESFEFDENGYLLLKGKIGDALEITMHLIKKDSSLTGRYFYDKIGMPIKIEGNVDESGKFKLTEYDAKYDETGFFVGTFKSKNTLSGNWIHPKTRKRLPFDLNIANDQAIFDVIISSLASKDCSNRDEFLKQPKGEFESFYDTMCSTMTVDLLTFKTNNPEVDKKINSKLLHYSGAPDNDLTVKGMLNSIHASADGFTESEQSYSILSKENDVLTILDASYTFMGGAHGLGGITYHNFDLNTGKEIKINDVLSKNYKTGLAKLAEQKLNATYVDYQWFFEEGNFLLNDNFAITPGGLLFYFNSYELTAYAYGQQELFFTYKELKKYILPNGPLKDFLK